MYDNKKVRFTYRLNDDLFQKLNEEANKKSVSVNAVINDILTEYFLFKANNPSVSVWNLINTATKAR